MFYIITKRFFFFYMNYRMPPRGSKRTVVTKELSELGEKARTIKPTEYANLSVADKVKYTEAYKARLDELNEKRNPNRPLPVKGADELSHLLSPTMSLVHKNDKGEYFVPENDNGTGKKLFSDMMLNLFANANFLDSAGEPIHKFNESINKDLMDMRVLSMADDEPNDDGAVYTVNHIYNQVHSQSRLTPVAGGGRKMRGGVDAVIPEVAHGTKEYNALKKVITEHDQKDIFNALPENVIRMSLLEDVLMIEDDNSVVPKVQITTAPFNFASGPILFYDPLCPNCKSLAPAYIAMAKMLRGKCPVGVVDCLDRMNGNDILKDYLGITGYPVIKVYSKGKFIDYTGGADLKKMLSFVCTATGVCLE
jgi:thiol-disulfide isomerase/thioredoxin